METIKEYLNKVEEKQLTPEEVINQYLKTSEKENENIFSFVRFHEDYIKKNLESYQNLPLKAAPIWVKDNFLSYWYVSSCGSGMLEDYKSPYSATCLTNLENQGAMMIWKTNMDEFAMWSSTENSYFGITKNPYGTDRIPGWSSWGSAASVANNMCLAAIWTDTGGSIRQPASMCGVVWFKPTYWTISRYWIQAMASSLDQAWTFTKTVEDTVILSKAMAWKDKQDATSIKRNDLHKWDEALKGDLKGFKIAVMNDFFSEWLDDQVKEIINQKIAQAKEKQAEVEYIDFPMFENALAVYYIVMPAELSTNLARFDGIRYGHQKHTFDFDSIYQYYNNIRKEGFGDETKRRIMVGTYVLSAGYYDAYYLRAQKVRKLLKREYDKIFKDYDAVIWPVSPTPAWKIWEKTDDPLKMYLSDVYTIPANLAGLPAMSLPAGYAEENGEKLPVGLHILSGQWQEDKIFQLAANLEENL